MEAMTMLVLGFQLLALFSIAGALLIYLICKVREDSVSASAGSHPSRVVLITSADTALGLQLCTHLANKGCRVFAGMKEAQDSLPAKLLSGWMKIREYSEEPISGTIIPMRLDVTREDVLREATVIMGANLNADERGIAAVINTSGSVFRGQVELQDVQQWEHMLRTNILGTLRVAKAFVSFLRPTRGRLLYLGGVGGGGSARNGGDGLVAFNASRVAVDKCAEELRKELHPYGVSVVALDTCGMTAESLYKAPMAQTMSLAVGAPTQYTADVLSPDALHVIERALWDFAPQQRYALLNHNKYQFALPCRSSLRLQKPVASSVGENASQSV
ncbi:uncharacterized protein LOC6555673 [Drosophila erecta]|uniref:Uncharacterized protein, isoform A n=1 Tax=Drosophila erecta TaxID=7220 RepID=B3P949_DROER|nr:uncharacterized protein LOC6555673 [Drosophila erecta]XP_026838911.1 uncharacterized protein LOC6555673 [Drosophila erecta]EDV45345.1 uncharacterized protein Dere_GG12768, isoform A [Drosophila erecta]KQS25939.1 uncharacterized protein Dere_GG12768, isoform B [Drosophila erecta]